MCEIIISFCTSVNFFLAKNFLRNILFSVSLTFDEFSEIGFVERLDIIIIELVFFISKHIEIN